MASFLIAFEQTSKKQFLEKKLKNNNRHGTFLLNYYVEN